jgi:hypothetical protein
VFSHFGVGLGERLAALCLASLCHAFVAATILKKLIPVLAGGIVTDFCDLVSLEVDWLRLLF